MASGDEPRAWTWAWLLDQPWVKVIRRTQEALMRDDVALVAGGLSFFGFLSLAPTLLVIVVSIGWILGAERATQEVLNVAKNVLGPEGASAIAMLLDAEALTAGSGWVAAGALLTSLYAATRVFIQMQQALNRTWDVRPSDTEGWRRRIRTIAKKRLVSAGVVVMVGLLILLSVIIKTILAAILESTPGTVFDSSFLWSMIEFTVSTLLIAAVLGTVYRVLPDVRIRYRDVASGALIAAILLQIGTKVLSWYLVTFAARSLSGAAATIIVTLLWLYITAWIFLGGAEIAAAIAAVRGHPITPDAHAEPIRQREA